VTVSSVPYSWSGNSRGSYLEPFVPRLLLVLLHSFAVSICLIMAVFPVFAIYLRVTHRSHVFLPTSWNVRHLLQVVAGEAEANLSSSGVVVIMCMQVS
jgi:hypothetical protein